MDQRGTHTAGERQHQFEVFLNLFHGHTIEKEASIDTKKRLERQKSSSDLLPAVKQLTDSILLFEVSQTCAKYQEMIFRTARTWER